ncbi:hypothetical protein CRYUN_Cryun41cG0023000 [Craigia yunnanensis]
MEALQNSVPSLHHASFLNSFPQVSFREHVNIFVFCIGKDCKSIIMVHFFAVKEVFLFMSELSKSSSASASSSSSHFQDSCGRRQMIAAGITAPLVSIVDQTPIAFQLLQKLKRNFSQSQTIKMDTHFSIHLGGSYTEVVIEGQDKVFKDVIEPLENVSVNMIPTSKQDILDFGSPQEHDVDGKAYYTSEFVTQAPNYTRHALTAVSIGNGKFYTLTIGTSVMGQNKSHIQ